MVWGVLLPLCHLRVKPVHMHSSYEIVPPGTSAVAGVAFGVTLRMQEVIL